MGAWGYRAVYLIDQGGAVAVLNSVNGAERGRNNFWLGNATGIRTSTNELRVPTTSTTTGAITLPCTHEVPYIIRFITANRTGAPSVDRISMFLYVQNDRLQAVETTAAPISLGQVVQTNPLYLFSANSCKNFWRQ